MRFCDECGAKLEDNAVFCDECGAKIEAVSGEVSNVTKESNSVDKQGEKKENKRPDAKKNNGGNKGTKILIIILTLLLCAAMVVIFLLLKDKGDESSTKAPDGIETEKNENLATNQPDIEGTQLPATKEPDSVETQEPATKEPDSTETQEPATKEPATKTSQTQAPTQAPTQTPTQAPTQTPKKTKVVLASKLTYDSYDNLTETSEYSYDKKGVLITEKKKIEEQNFEPGIIEYKYNKLGHVTEYTKTDLKGNYMYQMYYAYEYDANNNVIVEDYYAVDEENFFENEIDGHTEYTYDSKGNLTEEYRMNSIRYLGTDTYKNTYNEDGLLVAIECYYTDNWEYMAYDGDIYYTYDKNNRLIKEEKKNNGSVISRRNISYDENGNIIKETINNGITLEQTVIKYEYKTIEVE